MLLVPLLNPKFAAALAERLCELRVRGTSLTSSDHAFHIAFHARRRLILSMRMNAPPTLFDKLWAAHEIARREDGEALLWVDRHYVHEGSFNAFGQLKARGARVAEPGLTFGVADHYVPTRGSRHHIDNPDIARMVRMLEDNTAEHGIALFGLDDPRQGIVHVVGPEQGLSLPGMTIVCADSHTSTHGALGALAFGIGATEVAHVLATQTLWQRKPLRMRVTVDGQLGPAITARVPDPADVADADRRESMRRALAYMDLVPGTALEDVSVDRVFIGSCTNGRIEDLRSAAAVVKGRKVDRRVEAWVVPGSQ